MKTILKLLEFEIFGKISIIESLKTQRLAWLTRQLRIRASYFKINTTSLSFYHTYRNTNFSPVNSIISNHFTNSSTKERSKTLKKYIVLSRTTRPYIKQSHVTFRSTELI